VKHAQDLLITQLSASHSKTLSKIAKNNSMKTSNKQNNDIYKD